MVTAAGSARPPLTLRGGRIWASARAPGVFDEPVVGRFDGGRGIFECDDVGGGQPVRVRYTWFVDDTEPRFEHQERRRTGSSQNIAANQGGTSVWRGSRANSAERRPNETRNGKNLAHYFHSFICLLAVVIDFLRCWTVTAPNIIVGSMV